MKKSPRWQIRRWRILKSVLMSDDFQKLLPTLSADYQANKCRPTKYSLRVFPQFGIPGGCSLAVFALLKDPSLLNKDEKLMSLIQPPVDFISFKYKKIGPSLNPTLEFERWQSLRKAEVKDVLELHEGIYLKVSSGTTKQELQDFIDSYFDKELKPLLASVEEYFTPKALLQGRITEPSKLRARILALHKAGKTPKEIGDILADEHYKIEASNISRTISEANK